MTCEKCGKTATIHISVVKDGKTESTHLCELCGEAEIGDPRTFRPGKIAELRKKRELLEESLRHNRVAISTTTHFAASHQLRLYDGSVEELHEHDWKVKVTVSGPLDEIGVVMDFHELERLVEKILSSMRGRRLNDLEPFSKLNPSAENVASHIMGLLVLPREARVQNVEVWETPENSAICHRALLREKPVVDPGPRAK